MPGCQKRYTDPGSLRKHIKNHSKEEQEQVRRLKESQKVRRGGQSLLVQHLQDSWMVEQEMVNSTELVGIELMPGVKLGCCINCELIA